LKRVVQRIAVATFVAPLLQATLLGHGFLFHFVEGSTCRLLNCTLTVKTCSADYRVDVVRVELDSVAGAASTLGSDHRRALPKNDLARRLREQCSPGWRRRPDRPV